MISQWLDCSIFIAIVWINLFVRVFFSLFLFSFKIVGMPVVIGVVSFCATERNLFRQTTAQRHLSELASGQIRKWLLGDLKDLNIENYLNYYCDTVKIWINHRRRCEYPIERFRAINLPNASRVPHLSTYLRSCISFGTAYWNLIQFYRYDRSLVKWPR